MMRNDSTTTLPDTPIDLPRDYAVEQALSGSPESAVYRAKWRDQHVAVRITSTPSSGAQTRAELAVLSAVRHPGLARLLDHGSLPDGRVYSARSWIDGQPLNEWYADRRRRGEDADHRDLAVIVMRVCSALDHLHARGFVHADLKPENVIVTPAGEPILTDFGLSHERGARSPAGVSGTFFAIAPEALLGQAIGPKADLFALGVLMHKLLVGGWPSARDFYARFPEVSFLEAVGSQSSVLPEWARDLVPALLESDPDHRPASAAEVGRTLAARLGVAWSTSSGRVAVEWPLLCGREGWCAEWLSGLTEHSERDASTAKPSAAIQWWKLDAREDPRAWIDAVRLYAATRGVPTQSADASESLLSVRTSAQLDAWARDLVGRAAGAVLFFACSTDNWQLRAAQCLARTVLQTAARGGADDTTRLMVACPAVEIPHDVEWEVRSVPPVDEADVEAILARTLEEPEPERLKRFAALLHRASGGSGSRIKRLFESASGRDWFVAGAARPRLRPGSLDEMFDRIDADLAAPAQLGTNARACAAALEVCGRRALLEEIAEVAELDDSALAIAADELIQEHGASIERDSAGCARLALRLDVAALALSEDEWRKLHGRRALALRRRGADVSEQWPHVYRAANDATVVASAQAAAEDLRESGCAELALDLMEKIARQAELSGRELEPELAGERALDWVALGRPERALESIAALRTEGNVAAAALVERVRGHVATLRHDHEVAFEHFGRAADLDPSRAGDALVGEARILFEARRETELAALCDRAKARRDVPLSDRVRDTLETIFAMSLFRQGEVERARERIEVLLADAEQRGAKMRQAGLCINLATILRRTGQLQRAIDCFLRAEALYEREGFLPGLAQVRVLLAGALRESGQLVRAAPLFDSAIDLRERLADRAGASAARGMLGLLLADRGHVRAALQELDRMSAELTAQNRSVDAAVLQAKADELRARIGAASDSASPAKRGEATRTLDADPRILLARARALWMRGDLEQALDRAHRARELARRLQLNAPVLEAEFLHERLMRATRGSNGDGASQPAPEVDSAAGSACDDDEQVFSVLDGGLDDARAVRLAAQLAERGRDDRAARINLALAARSKSGEVRRAAQRAADEALRRCSAGLTQEQALALRGHLLSMPDPWPADLIAEVREDEGEWDMELVKLFEINHRLVQQQDLRELLGAIVEAALQMTGAQRGFLVLEENGSLSFDTALDSRRGDIAVPELEVSKSILNEALGKMTPLRLSNASDDPLHGSSPSVSALELRSILCAPFEIDTGLRGVIYLDHRLREGAFAERAERSLALLADQAALAIRQVRRMEEIRRLNRELSHRVATQESDLRAAQSALREASLTVPASGLIGSSPAMRAVHSLIDRAAQSKLAVLVTGQSGTGKELAARALHALSPRRAGPFVSENCAALPAALIEAELFGYKKGAYTGAEADRPGMFERAHTGTLFLDEIGDLPLELQAKLLRVLETSEVRRLGDNQVHRVDFRLVAATNRDLEADVSAGTFRADLFYRLDGLRIAMPPLASRVEDIPALIEHFLRLEEARTGKERRISPAVVTRLCRREWPGNVRELANEVSRLCVMSEGDLTDPDMVRTPGPASHTMSLPEHCTLAELERLAIERALKQTGGDKRKAAEILGISRAKVYQRIKEWEVERSAGGSGAD